jgi:subtilisin family serine protease
VYKALAVLLAVAALDAPGRAADAGAQVVARGQTAHLKPQTVEAVARLAEPTRIAAADWPDARQRTAAEVIRALCGSIQPGYLEALQSENGLDSVDLAGPLGDRAFALRWPACVRINPNRDDRVAFITSAGDTAISIARLLAGPATADRAGREMLAKLKPVSMRAPLPAGVDVVPAFTAPPTPLVPRDGSAATLRAAVAAAAGSDVTVGEPEQLGMILTGTLADAVAPGCTPHAAPVPAKVIAEAFALSRAFANSPNRLGMPLANVRILVIDNGFFGVRCDDGAICPMLDAESKPLMNDARFPRLLFDTSGKRSGSLGIDIGRGSVAIHPINYRHDLPRPADTDVTAGHGTHVAGLALGGPAFVPFRDAFKIDEASWLKLVNLNIARGERTFFSHSLDSALRSADEVNQGFRILNLSIGIDSTRAAVTGPLQQFIEGLPALKASLLVMAAGNGGPANATAEVWPAALAQEGRRNLVSVASIDGDGRLSAFTSHGSNHVTMAAPGCAIVSWLSAESGEVAVNGTSQATPLVSFTAALVHAVLNLDAASVRDRLILSGRLIADPAERGKTIYGTELDIPRAVLVHHDLLGYRPDGMASSVRTFVGRLDALPGIRCAGPAPVDRSQIGSLKRGPDGLLLYRIVNGVQRPCRTAALERPAGAVPTAEAIRFFATHELTADGLIELAAPEFRAIRFDELDRLDELVTSESR